CGEMLALGSLLLEGTPIRFTGQDVQRGTFSHRHAVLNDYNTGKPYTPLNFLTAGTGQSGAAGNASGSGGHGSPHAQPPGPPPAPGNYFHMLRRQIHRRFRKPLVCMMPKSLLRSQGSYSKIEEMTEGSIQLVIDDPAGPERDSVKRVLFCSGKVYYSLASVRD